MRKNILIIDDDTSITSIFEFILQESGYNTFIANTGEDGLKILQEKKVDLIFLDVKMPGMSGIEIFTKIREKDPNILVVMMTGYSVDELLQEAYELGAYGVIYKPFDVEEVLAIIEKIFTLPI